MHCKFSHQYYTSFPVHLDPDVRIGFEMTDYTVSEGIGEVILMVSILEGASSSPVRVLLSTMNNTAFSECMYQYSLCTAHISLDSRLFYCYYNDGYCSLGPM